MFDNNFKETEYTDVICENCSDQKGNSTKSTFEMSQSLKTPPIVLRFFSNNAI